MASHAFVKACEAANVENARLRHVMVFRDERLVATASLSLMDVSLDLLDSSNLRPFFISIRKRYPSFMRVPVLFCGLPVSFGQSSLRIRDGVDRPGILSAVAELMEVEGRRLDARILCFKEFDQSTSEELGSLIDLGYVRTNSLPACSMAVRWHSFDEYLRQMRANYRRLIRSSLRIRNEAGLTVRLADDFAADSARIFSLYEQVMDRAPFQLERLNLQYFRNLNAFFGCRSRAILLERGQRLLAAAILLESRSVCRFLLAGIDYRLNRRYQSYLNIVIEVVAEAIRSGASTLILGQTSYPLKQRMGGKVAPLYLFIRYRSKLGNALLRMAAPSLFPQTSVENRRVFKR
jgi:hypothetical protein